MQTKSAACGKRLLALMLAIVMVCSLLPVSAFAAEPDYELRVLTFEDADYKGGTNFAAPVSIPSTLPTSGRIRTIPGSATPCPRAMAPGATGAAVMPFPTMFPVRSASTAALRVSLPFIKRTFPVWNGPAAATTARITSPCITVMPIIPAMA